MKKIFVLCKKKLGRTESWLFGKKIQRRSLKVSFIIHKKRIKKFQFRCDRQIEIFEIHRKINNFFRIRTLIILPFFDTTHMINIVQKSLKPNVISITK